MSGRIGLLLLVLFLGACTDRAPKPVRGGTLVVLMGWESDFKLSMRDLFHSSALSGPFQLASFSDARVDSILDQTAVITKREESLPLWRRFETIMRETQPWSFLFYYPDLILLSDRVRDVRMDIRGVFVNVPEWWLAPAQND